MYNDTIEYILNEEKENRVFVIQPGEDLPVSRTEKSPDKLRETYEIGRKTAIACLPDILCYLGEEESSNE